MKSVVITGHRITKESPRSAREDHDLWGVTRANTKFWKNTLTDWTEWHDYHPLTTTLVFEGLPARRPMVWKWMLQQNGVRPIYVQDPRHASNPDAARRLFDLIPGATALPIEDIRDHWKLSSGELESLFYCQAGIMLAFAGMRGFTRVVLNGIGDIHTQQSEYAHRCVYYWMGRLRGAGVEVEVEGPSTFRQPLRLYGYEHVEFPDLVTRTAVRRAERYWPTVQQTSVCQTPEHPGPPVPHRPYRPPRELRP